MQPVKETQLRPLLFYPSPDSFLREGLNLRNLAYGPALASVTYHHIMLSFLFSHAVITHPLLHNPRPTRLNLQIHWLSRKHWLQVTSVDGSPPRPHDTIETPVFYFGLPGEAVRHRPGPPSILR